MLLGEIVNTVNISDCERTLEHLHCLNYSTYFYVDIVGLPISPPNSSIHKYCEQI